MTSALANDSDAQATGPSAGDPGPRMSRPLTWLVWLGFVVGFVVALIAVARPRWYPILDLAQTEIRLRDVFTAHPPLIGLPGRIGSFQHQGSHPGPLSFWALAPFYRVLGGSAWAMQAATAALNAIALGLSLMIARRRGGRVVFLGFAAALASLTYFYGPSVLTQAWNPYLPLMWFLVFVLGVWSVFCDDWPMLPIAAFAAAFCVQTHISYLGIVGGLGALALAWTVWSLVKRPQAFGDRRWLWIVIAAGLVIASAIPPIWQELGSSEGNLTLIWRHFTDPPEDAIGLLDGARVLLVHLNPVRLLIPRDGTSGSLVPGGLMLGVWLASVVVAVRARVRPLIALDVVLVVVLGLGLLSIASIFGFVWYYLMFWGWALNAFMLVATVWAGVIAFGDRPNRVPARDSTRPSAGSAGAGSIALAAIMVGYLTGFAVDASTLEPPAERVSETLSQLVPQTIRAIDDGSVPGGGRDGRYQVTIVDTVTINAPGYGLASELERAGIHAGFPDNVAYRAILRPQRIVSKSDATAVVHYSVGRADIEKWESTPGVTKIGTVDPRSPAEKAEVRRLRREVRRDLRAAGFESLIANLDQNVFMATFVPGLPKDVQDKLLRLLDIGEPSAVFVGPPSLAE